MQSVSASASAPSRSPMTSPPSAAPPRLHNPRLPADKSDISIPQARRIAVDTTGAQIVQEESVATRDSRGIYLPHYIEPVSHIAIDIGGSLAKVVYFTRSSAPIIHTPPATTPSSPFLPPSQSVSSPNAAASTSRLPDEDDPSLSPSAETRLPTVNGALKPQALVEDYLSVPKRSSAASHRFNHSSSSTSAPAPRTRDRRFSSSPQLPQPLPGGLLNFARFETANIDDLIRWLADLIHTSAAANRVSVERMKSTVKVMVTGGGAYMYNDRLATELGVEVVREEEMESLILGLGFVARIPEEVFWFSEELVWKVSHPDPTGYHSHSVLPNGYGDGASGQGEGKRLESGEERLARVNGAGGMGSKLRNGSPTTATFPDPSATPASSVPNGRPDSPSSGLPNGTATAPPLSEPGASSTSTSKSKPDLRLPPPSPAAPPQAQPELERPSPTPPQYSVTFATPSSDPSEEPEPNFPCLVVNIGSGVSIVRVDEDGGFERVSGTSLGGGTLWGLLSLLTDARSFDEMLLLSEQGDNTEVDMLVGDIYGSDYSKIGLKSSTIASTFGKVFKKGQTADERKKGIRQEDVARSLLYAVSNNIGHVAYMNAAKYGLNKVFFSGCFIRGHASTISTLSYAIRFWSKGTMRACFLRHEGFLGAIGAWIKNVEQLEETDGPNGMHTEGDSDTPGGVRQSI